MNWRVLTVIFVTLACASAADATDRYFPDSSAVSANGRYRIDAKSPDNAGAQPRPFASNFTYTLTDTSTGAVIWQRSQPMTRSKGSAYVSSSEPSPVQVFVTDDGLVAARTCWDTLVLLDPKNGRKRAEAQVLKAFPQEEQDAFVSMSTAGPIWSQGSKWYFLRVAPADKPPSTYFVIRPYWNKRLVIDAATGDHVDLGKYRDASSRESVAGADERVRGILEAAIAEEHRRALSVLKAAPEQFKGKPDYEFYWEVRAALHTVGFLKLSEAEPPLRALEQGFDDNKDDYTGLRAKVREALRCIGKTPAPGYGVRLYPMVNQGLYMSPDSDRPFNAKVSAEERTANAGKIESGMSTKQLTDLVGCPDAQIFDGGHCYDYDIDAPTPYTIRIFLDRDSVQIVSLKRITPFAFLHDPARMRDY